MDNILPRLASVQGRRDEIPNQELAKEIVESKDKDAIKQLINHLINHKEKRVKQDCIKVLYEIGGTQPELISSYAKVFVDQLSSKNNRLVWGGMTALDAITLNTPEKIVLYLKEIEAGIKSGSVITKDRSISILAKLSSISAFYEKAFPLLIDELWNCPPKQLPMYAEMAIVAITEENKIPFENLLNQRLDSLEKDSQRRRIKKIQKKLDSV